MERTDVFEANGEGLVDLVNWSLTVSKLPSAERDGGHRMPYMKCDILVRCVVVRIPFRPTIKK